MAKVYVKEDGGYALIGEAHDVRIYPDVTARACAGLSKAFGFCTIALENVTAATNGLRWIFDCEARLLRLRRQHIAKGRGKNWRTA